MKDEVFHFCYSEVPPTLAEGNGSAKFVKVEYNSKNLLLLLRRIQIYPNRVKSKMKDESFADFADKNQSTDYAD